MDSFQKRQRERRKIEKRTEKEARRKERADLVREHRASSEAASVPAVDPEPTAGESPAAGPRPPGDMP